MDNSWIPVWIALENYRKNGGVKKKPLSKRELKARAFGYKIGGVIGIIVGIAIGVAMIVMFCS